MFITSRESAIVPLPHPPKLPAPYFPARRLILGDALALYACPRAFGVPSIYQPGKTLPPSEFPRFAGFYACFPEFTSRRGETCAYMLRYMLSLTPLEVVSQGGMFGHSRTGNRSTRDGTEVLYRPLKLLFLLALAL